MRTSRESSKQKPANLLNAAAALKLYDRLISPGGPVGYLEVAALLGVVPATVHRQCTGDIPIQLRTVVALMQLDPEGGRQLLDLLGEACGIVWSEEAIHAKGDRQVMASACRTIQSLSRLMDSIAKAIEDGAITPNEVDDLLGSGSRGEHAIKTFLAQVQGVGSRKVETLRAERTA